MKKLLHGFLLCFVFANLSPSTFAGVIFSDNFDTGASVQWGNEFGSWGDVGGVYSAGSGSNFPNSHSSLPFNLTDFTIEVDINDVEDGGIWLRSAPSVSPIGRIGVLLVTGGGASGDTGLYWHVVTGTGYGSAFGIVTGLFTPGVSDPSIRVTASGNTYSAFVNGSALPATTLIDSNFTSGQVALYDFSGQTFDNVVLSDSSSVPEPSSMILLGFSLFCVILFRFWKRTRTGHPSGLQHCCITDS